MPDARAVLGGSVAKGTDLEGVDASDVDIVLIFANFTPEQHSELLAAVELSLRTLHVDTEQRSFYFSRAPNIPPRVLGLLDQPGHGNRGTYVHGVHKRVSFDVLVGGEAPMDPMRVFSSLSRRSRVQLGACFVEPHVHFVNRLSIAEKNAIRLAKWWCGHALSGDTQRTAGNQRSRGRPIRSFMIELLVAHGAQTVRRVESFFLFRTFLELLVEWRQLRITWEWNHAAVSQTGRRRRRPVILDPCNPTNDLARGVRCWSFLQAAASETLAVLGQEAGTRTTARPRSRRSGVRREPWLMSEIYFDTDYADGDDLISLEFADLDHDLTYFEATNLEDDLAHFF